MQEINLEFASLTLYDLKTISVHLHHNLTIDKIISIVNLLIVND
jgi:hypothetical protein